MNGLLGFTQFGDLDTHLLPILIFILMRDGDDSGMIFALGYLLISDDKGLPLTRSERRSPPLRVSGYPPPGGGRR